jgi:N-acetylneuraminic acid mutarotase
LKSISVSHIKEGAMKNLSLLFIAFLFLCLTTFAQWTQKADIPTARCLTASCTLDGKIYVIGGTESTSPDGPSVGTMEIYDPFTDSWDTTKAPMPTSRVELGACAVSGKIYAIGGAYDHSATTYGMVEEYDPSTNLWNTSKEPMPTPRKGAAYGVIDNKIYVAGGSAVHNWVASNKLEIYDPATDTWVDTLATMMYAMYEPEGAVINDKFYVIGGLIGSPWTGQETVQMYDPITDTWSHMADLNNGRVGHTTNAVAGKIYAIGGDRQPPIVRSVEEYNNNTNSWTVVDTIPFVKIGHTASAFENKIYLISGSLTSLLAGFTPTSTVYSFDVPVGVETQDNIVPEYFVLYQNYPNPFNPRTKIKYSIPQSSKVIIKIYDVLGNEIETLVYEEKPVGTYEITWYAENLPSGVYFYRLQAGDFIQTKKMVLMK